MKILLAAACLIGLALALALATTPADADSELPQPPRAEPQHAAEAGAEIDRLSSAIEQLLERMEHKRPR